MNLKNNLMTNLQKNTLENQISQIKNDSVKIRIRFIYNVFNERFVTPWIHRIFMELLQNIIIGCKGLNSRNAVIKITNWFRQINLNTWRDAELMKKYKAL